MNLKLQIKLDSIKDKERTNFSATIEEILEKHFGV